MFIIIHAIFLRINYNYIKYFKINIILHINEGFSML